jgi:hypothetical protein
MGKRNIREISQDWLACSSVNTVYLTSWTVKRGLPGGPGGNFEPGGTFVLENVQAEIATTIRSVANKSCMVKVLSSL